MNIRDMHVTYINVSQIDADDFKVEESLTEEFKRDEKLVNEYLAIPVFVRLKENGRYELISGKTGFAVAYALNKLQIPAHIIP